MLKKLIENIKNYYRFRLWPTHIRLIENYKLSKEKPGAFLLIFSMFAKLAQADGRQDQEEVDLINDFMDEPLGLNPKSKLAAFKIYTKALTLDLLFEEYAEYYFQLYKKNKGMLEKAIDLLIALALADDKFGTEESKLINKAKRIFRLTDLEYERIFEHYKTHGNTFQDQQYFEERFNDEGNCKEKEYDQPQHSKNLFDHHLHILGCSPTSSEKEIKSAYRNLIKQHHPDKLREQGLSEEFLNFSEQRFIEIQKAYEYINST